MHGAAIRWTFAGAAGLALALVTATSRADPTAAEKAAAEALFEEAKRLMDANDFATACPKLQASERLDHGIGVLLYLADCYERNGQTASAWATFLDARAEAAAAGQTDRLAIARVRVAALEPKLVRLTIEVPQPLRRLEGLVVQRDGKPVQPAAYGVAIPVDPGQHAVEVLAAGRSRWATTIGVGPENASAVLTVGEPALLPDDERGSSPAAPAVIGADGAAGSSDGATQHTIAVIAGGVGIASVVAGTLFGLRAKSQYDDAHEQCRTETRCGPAGVAGVEDAEGSAAASTALFVAGAGVLALGVVLFVTAPTKDRASGAGLPMFVRRAGRGMALGGAW